MKQTIKHPLFILGLFIKLIFLWFPGSEYLNELFIPFIDQAIVNLGENPWNLLPPHYFPYGTVLFTLLFIPKFLLYLIFGDGALGLSSLSFFSIKIVLLAADLIFLRALIHLAPQRRTQSLIYYWLNPVLFYISFIHGQLDVIPMLFSTFSVIALSQDRLKKSGLWAVLAVLSKFHTIVIIPFCLAFLWNTRFTKSGLKQISSWLSIVGGLSLVGFLPILSSKQLDYVSIGSPEALKIFGAQLVMGKENTLYIGFAVFAGILFRLCFSTKITREGLIYGAGFLYGILLIVVDAMPGWYYWVFPFFALFYATYSMTIRPVFWIACALYLFYFNPVELLGQQIDEIIYGGAFTLLQTSILGILLTMWFLILKYETPLRGRTRPLLIGLAGNSGSGKDTTSQLLKDLLGQDTTEIVPGDDYHKWERGHTRWTDYTHLHPKANHLDSLAKHTSQLATGRLVFHPHYDHASGRFTTPRLIRSSRSVLVQGLHTFYFRKMRDLFDIKIFLAPDEELRTAWKLIRDVGERGHTAERVIKSIKDREIDSKTHIDPQKRWSDWIIEYKPKSKIDLEQVLKGEVPEHYVRHTLWNDAPINSLMEQLTKEDGLRIQLDIAPDSIDRIHLIIDGDLSATRIREIAHSSFTCLRHLTRGRSEPKWHSGYSGISQLLALALFQDRRSGAQ